MRATWPTATFRDVPPSDVAVELATQVRFAVGKGTDRLDLEACCELGGFELVRAHLGAEEGGEQAFLIPRPGGFRIAVDPTPPGGWRALPPEAGAIIARRRMRFRAAHEIGHSFFYLRHRTRRPVRRFPPGARDEERFCNVFAAALLIPPDQCDPAEGGFDPAAPLDLRDRFDVSLEVAVRACAESMSRPTTIALFTVRDDPSGSGARISLEWLRGNRRGAAPRTAPSFGAALDALKDLGFRVAADTRAGQVVAVASA